MKKKSFRLLINFTILLLCPLISIAQYWENIYGVDTDVETGKAVTQTQDSGFMIAGDIEESPIRIQLIKTNSLGEMMWSKVIEEDQSNSVYDMLETESGNLLIAGKSKKSGDTAPFLILVDSLGNTLWSKHYDQLFNGANGGFNTFKRIKPLDNGNFILSGTYSIPRLMFGMIVDASGNIVKANAVGIEGFGTAGRDVVSCSDGGFLFIGEYTEEDNLANVVSYVVKTDADLEEEWTWLSDSDNLEFGQTAVEFEDHYYCIVGSSELQLLKLTSDGQEIFRVPIVTDDNETARDMIVTPENELIITGGNGNAFTCKLDFSGNVIWYRNYLFENHDSSIGNDIDLINNGEGLIICGASEVEGIPGMSTDVSWYYLIHTDENGSITSTNNLSLNLSVLLYPNPTTNSLVLELDTSTFKEYAIHFYASNGSLVKTDQLNHSSYQVNTMGWSPGMYIYTITDDGGKNFTGKFVVK